MGHNHPSPLPRTRKWVKVVALIRGGAGAAQVANATVTAAEKGLKAAPNDTGVIETIWLLMKLPFAARSDNFAEALRDCGLSVSQEPGLMEIVAAVTEAIDAKMPNNRGRSDLGEMAQMAAAETLTDLIGGRLSGLFDSTHEEVQKEFARLGTSKQFGIFAKDFFTRFTYKVLDFFLSKTLPDHVGDGQRFQTLGQQEKFTQALDQHCRETAKILETYSGGWLNLHNFDSGGNISREMVSHFTAYAMTKLINELRQRATPDAA